MGFYNVVGGIKFFITEPGIRRIVLKGNNNEKLAGMVNVTMNSNDPAITAFQNDLREVTLIAPTDPTRPAPEFVVSTSTDTTWYFITLPPVNFSNGFTLTLLKDDTQGVKSYSARTINRNKFQPYGKAANDGAVWTVIPPQANQIRYTATGQVYYYIPDDSGTGNIVVSNTWDPSTGEGLVTFAAPITVLDKEAFHGQQDLTSVTLPESIISIGESAFKSCSNLSSVTMGDNVQTICQYAFRFCSSLGQIRLSNKLEKILHHAFSQSGLTQIHLPESLTIFGPINPFTECENLASFSGKFATDDGLFLICDGELIAGAIGAAALGENTTCTLPEGITRLGHSCLHDLKSSSIDFGNNAITRMEHYCLSESRLAGPLLIPASVTEIKAWAFNGCSSLSIVLFSEDVLPTIGKDAFGATYSENTFKIYIPGYSTVTSSEKLSGESWSAYNRYNRDRLVVYQPDNEVWYHYQSVEPTIGTITDASGNTVYVTATLSNQNYRILPCAPSLPFSNQWNSVAAGTELQIMRFDQPVISIGVNAFKNQMLDFISLPDAVTTIGVSAFEGCAALLTFPSSGSSLTTIGGSAFYGCAQMAFPGNKNYLALRRVNSLGSNAFFNCQNFGTGSENAGSVLLLGPVATIPDYAFYKCDELTHIYVSENHIASVGMRAFYGCSGLKALAGLDLLNEDDSVNLPGTTSIGQDAFGLCSSITDVILGTLTNIPRGAFGLCENLQTVSLNTDALTTIGQNAFSGCRLLTQIGNEANSVNLPYVRNIENEAFSNCQNIVEIKLSNIHSVGNRAFAYTRKLENIHFGKFLNTLGELIFYDSITDNTIRNYDKLNLYFNGSYPALVSALNSSSPTFGYTGQTDYFWPNSIRVQNQDINVLEAFYSRLPVDWNETIRSKIQLRQIP